MSFDDFCFDHYLLYEFTKKELIYMDINGDIPFHMLSFAKDDEEFAAVRRTIVEKKRPCGVSRATVEFACSLWTRRGFEPRTFGL